MVVATVTVAAVQMPSVFGDVAGNSARLERLVHRAADAGAKVIVSPECCIPGYSSDDLRCIWHAEGRPVDDWFEPRDVMDVAEPVPGPTTERLGRLARGRGVWLLIGMIERLERAAHNAAVLLSPAGEVAAVHRKRWLWPAVEPAWATAGDLPAVRCRTPFGTVGVAVCYDVHRVRRLYAPGDLWALLFPAAWVDVEPPGKYFDRRFPKVAAALGCHVVFANRCSPVQTVRFYGSGESTVYRPDGAVAARSGARFEEDVVLAALPVAGPS